MRPRLPEGSRHTGRPDASGTRKDGDDGTDFGF